MKYLNQVGQAKMSIQKKIDVTELGKTCEAIMTLKLKSNI